MKKVSGESLWGKGKRRNAKSRNGSNDNVMRAIKQLIDERDWKKARALLLEELIYRPAEHWVWMDLSLAYYEDKEYEKALECSKRAVELAPKCPLALWHYAGSLYMNGQESAAAAIWNLILNADLEEIAYGECGEGLNWAMRLVNDVQYRIGRYYEWRGEHELARPFFEKYLHNRAHGVPSTYDETKVRASLARHATSAGRSSATNVTAKPNGSAKTRTT